MANNERLMPWEKREEKPEVNNSVEEIKSEEVIPEEEAKPETEIKIEDVDESAEVEEPAEAEESTEEFEKAEEIITDKKKLHFYEHMRQTVRRAVTNKAGEKSSKIVDYLLTLPDFFILLTRLGLDKRVTKVQKLFVGGIIGYLIMPIDLIPDFIPVFGFVDDLVLVVYALNTMLNEIDANIVKENWSGDGDVLELLKKITRTAEEFLDKKILKKIKKFIEKMGKAS